MTYNFRVTGNNINGLEEVFKSIKKEADNTMIHSVDADTLKDAINDHMAQIDDGIFENYNVFSVYVDSEGVEHQIIGTREGWVVE